MCFRDVSHTIHNNVWCGKGCAEGEGQKHDSNDKIKREDTRSLQQKEKTTVYRWWYDVIAFWWWGRERERERVDDEASVCLFVYDEPRSRLNFFIFMFGLRFSTLNVLIFLMGRNGGSGRRCVMLTSLSTVTLFPLHFWNILQYCVVEEAVVAITYIVENICVRLDIISSYSCHILLECFWLLHIFGRKFFIVFILSNSFAFTLIY